MLDVLFFGGGLAAILLVYLTVALARPEKF